MSLETGSFINDLTATNPINTDPVGQGDDHLRLIKTCVKGTFPNQGTVFGEVRQLDVATSISSTWNNNLIVSSASATTTVVLTLPSPLSITSGFTVNFFVQSGAALSIVPSGGALINAAASMAVPDRQYGYAAYQGSSGWRAAFGPTGAGAASHFFGGAVSISGTVVVGGDLSVAGAAGFGGAVTFASAVAITGFLDVHDQLSVSGSAVMNGAVTMNSTLSVSGIATFKSGITVSGVAILNSQVTMNSGLTLSGAFNAKTIASFGGAVTMASTLSVSGAFHANTTLSVGGAATLGTTLSVSGAAVLGNTLAVRGAVTLDSALSVSGAVNFGGSLGVGGTLTVGSAAAITGFLDVHGQLSVSASTILAGTLLVGGITTFSAAVHMKSTLSVGGAAVLNGGAIINGAVSISGGVVVTGLINTTNGQIQFPAIANPSANANTLDDYEEGTWTPALTYTTPGTLAVTYSGQSGSYTKIGRVVHALLAVITSTHTLGTASGNLLVSNLPFAPSVSPGLAPGKCSWQGITKASYTEIDWSVLNGATDTQFIASGSGQPRSNVVAGNTATGTNVALYGNVTYHI